MNGIFLIVAITGMLFLSGCGSHRAPNEEVSQQSQATVFRAPETSADDEELTTTPQRVPGETKPKSP